MELHLKSDHRAQRVLEHKYHNAFLAAVMLGIFCIGLLLYISYKFKTADKVICVEERGK